MMTRKIKDIVMALKFLGLPNELLLLVAGRLGAKDLASFLSCNRHLRGLLTSLLHRIAIQDVGGLTALQWAALKGHESLARFLLRNGAEVDVRQYPPSYTALHLAAQKGNTEVVRLLLANGATIEIMDRRYETALHMAAMRGKIDVVRLLLDKGADVAVWNLYRSQPLHLAAEGLREDVVRLLLEKGANIKVMNWNNHTPLSLAEEQANSPQKQAVVKLLKEAAGELPNPAEGGWLISLQTRRRLFLARRRSD